MVAQGALGAQMRSLGLATCLVAELPRSVAFPLGLDPFQLGLDPSDRLVTAGLVTLGLAGVVADDKGCGSPQGALEGVVPAVR